MKYRHGDVNLHLVDIDLTGFRKLETKDSYVLAKGEATGSVHLIATKNPDDLEVYEHEGTIFIRLTAPAEVTHTSDHETLVIQPGTYKQVPEREIDHFQKVIRKVAD